MKQIIRRLATSLILIAVVAFGVRLAFAWNQTDKIPRQFVGIVPFQTETGHIAYSLATGKGFASPFQRDSGPTAWLTPIYPLIIAGLFKIFGAYTRAAFFAAVFLNIVFSAATCVPIFYAGRRVLGIGVASGAGWLWALFPNAVIIPFEWIWDTSLAALLAATLLWATLVVGESRRWQDWCRYGLLWGASLMTNPALVSVFPFLLVWLIFRSRHAGQLQFARPALAAIITLVCCIPWTARNFAVFHRFIPFRSNLSYELYIGNNENYDERRRALPTIITQDMEALRYLRMGESAFMDEEKRKAFRFIRTHPAVEMKLIGWRFVDFWMGVADPWRTFSTADSWLVRGILLGNFLSALGVLIGATALFLRRNTYAIPLATFPAIFPILYYLTHTSLRYRHPIDCVVMLLTAIAAVELWRIVRPGGRSRNQRESQNVVGAGERVPS